MNWPDNQYADGGDGRGLRLRLAGDRLGLRRQRLSATSVGEGLSRRRAGVRTALCRPRVSRVHGRLQALLLAPEDRLEGNFPSDDVQRRVGRERLWRGRRQPWL